MNIHDILLAQRREIEAGRSALYVGRSSVVEPVAGGRIRVVVGPRRAGKSSYALHRTSTEPGAWGYANFDDERLGSLEDYDELVVALDALYGCPQGFFFDEIQNLPKWELFVNRLHRAGRNLILTGSNAHLLSSELATHLTGRHVQIPLLPFSFPEFVAAEGGGERTDLEIRFFFWKDPHGIEADFVVQEGLAIRQIVQVSLDTTDPKTRQREIRGLCKASRDLGCGDLLLLTEKEECQTQATWEGSVYPIRSVPIWKWLLAAELG